MNRLRSLLKLERGEEAPAFLLFLYLTLAMASYIVVKSASKALYLSRYSSNTLPYIYIGVAVLAGVVGSIYVRLSSRMSQVTLISGTLLFFIGNVLLLWWGLRVQWSPIAVIYILWTGIFGVIVATQVWTVGNHVLDLRQAKRLFPLVASGGILGSAGGGLMGATLVKRVGTDNLVLVLVPILLLSVAIVQILIRRHGFSSRPGRSEMASGETKKGVSDLFDTIKSSRYIKLIVGLVVLSAIAGLIINWQFDTVVQKSFRSKDPMTGFLSSFQGLLGLFSFLAQVFVGSRIVEKLGVRVTLLMLPLALLGGTAVLVLNPLRLWAGILLRSSDGALRYSIDRATFELLYLPVPQSVKAEVKAAADVVVNRLADLVGGVLLLVMTRFLGLGVSGVGLFNIVLISIWLWVALRTRKEYVETVRANLSERPELPKATLKMVFSEAKSIASLRAMLESKDEEVVLYAMDLALALGRKDWIPAKLTTHPSPRVRMKALEIVPMTEHEILDRVRTERDSAVRASGIVRACRAALPGEPLAALERYLHVPSLKVRLAALVCLARETSDHDAQALKDQLSQITSDLAETSEQWKDVAEALGEIRHPATVDLHIRLLRHQNLQVRKEAIRSAARSQQRELVPFLVRLLADRDLGAEARRALQEWGPRILGTMSDILRDPKEEIDIRRSIPLVLAYVPSQATADLLLECLFDYDGLLRYRAIRALGKLYAIDPDLRVDPERVGLCIREDCEKTLGYQQALACLYPKGESSDFLALLLNDKINYGRERVFRLLGLILPQRDAYACFVATKEEDRLKKAHVAEYLENVLPAKLKESVLAFVEAKKKESREADDVARILETFMKSPDPILRDCVMDAIAKGGWPEVSRTTPIFRRLEGGFSYG